VSEPQADLRLRKILEHIGVVRFRVAAVPSSEERARIAEEMKRVPLHSLTPLGALA
jgi:hypothetical protein